MATVAYDSDSGDIDIDEYMDELLRARTPEKRGWCRPGFTMNPVLNRCVPTMRSVHDYLNTRLKFTADGISYLTYLYG